eukprot:CAMPEP_0205912388 /NCGR_PEP_ID=MMETSP1325-20131115/5800_1 /ASSEMBLY_ACC=CAM_ASM_000708 /TAXON_ID=236786 /ORGANISM="Florenciella sp., Strain RCC1007" /LENGTH=117 /DNA_ID=CAMNT_0053279079 /DNA_START=115 /DNA_END=466 /DNA_ORIENTATION=+
MKPASHGPEANRWSTSSLGPLAAPGRCPPGVNEIYEHHPPPPLVSQPPGAAAALVAGSMGALIPSPGASHLPLTPGCATMGEEPPRQSLLPPVTPPWHGALGSDRAALWAPSTFRIC